MNILMVANGTLSVAHQELVIGAALKKAGHGVQIIHDLDFGFFNKNYLPPPLVEDDIVKQAHGDYSAIKTRINPDIIFGLDQSVAPFVLTVKQHIPRPALCMFLDFPKHVIDHGSPADYNPDYSSRYYQWLGHAMQLDNIIFNNEVAVKEWYIRENVMAELVWYPLCNLEDIAKVKKKGNALKDIYTDPYIASCHRFINYKGTEYLVKALYGIEGIKYHAVSVSGNIEKQVEAYAKSVLSDRFIYTKRAEEQHKLEIIRGALVFCYPQITYWVGGLSSLEAMALGTPVVCYDYPVLRELYGDSVVYAEKKSVDSLQEKLVEVLNEDIDEQSVRIQKGKERIKKFFTPDVMARKLTGIFEKYL
jgi:glycosyltransferase involved in cell wall biosynthesis